MTDFPLYTLETSIDERLDYLATLEDGWGWHDGSGMAMDPAAIAYAREVAPLFAEFDFGLFPCVDKPWLEAESVTDIGTFAFFVEFGPNRKVLLNVFDMSTPSEDTSKDIEFVGSAEEALQILRNLRDVKTD